MKYLINLALVALLLACSSPETDVAGFGSETTNGFITITVTGASSYDKVKLQILPKGYNAITDKESDITTAELNKSGVAEVKLTDGENYTIYAVDTVTGNKLYIQDLGLHYLKRPK